MSFPRYPAYKPSGVEWLGEVPEHWDILPLKRRSRLLTEKTECRDNPVALENIEGWTGRFVETDTEFQGEGIAFESGDILFGKLRPYLAKVYLAAISGQAVGDFHVIHPLGGLNSRFLQLALLTRELIDLVNGSTFGAKMPRASWDFLGSLPLCMPPLDEQHAIASFLDRETAKIDTLIAEQQRLIELLQEKRQAVISHAVTKGLNPNAPMKDSGVEWLGEVPQHWGILRLKRIALKRCDGPFGSGLKSEHYVESGVFVVRLQNIKEAGLDSSSKAFIDTGYYHQELGDHDVEAGDILIAGLGDENNPVGRACVAPVEIEPAMVKADCFRYRLDASLVNPYFAALSLNTSARYHGGKMSSGSTRARIPLSQMSEREIALPSLEEQTLIVEKLVVEMSAMDSLHRSSNDAVDLLHERRSALISAAVTGQIDVRGLVEAEGSEQ